MSDGGVPARRRWWRRPVGIEAAAVGCFIVIGPFILHFLAITFGSLFRGIGVAGLVDYFNGGTPFTDIGWEVASARALVDATHSMYESIDVLAQLIGMSAYDVGSHTHPPTSVVLWIPLGFLPYWIWLPLYVCVALAAIAASLRVMRVPAWLAYPLAVAIAVTPTGTFALTTTYPVMALVLSLAWKYRDQPGVAAPAYAFLAAARGVGGVLLLYPVLKRQWRTLVVALAILGLIGLVAVLVEPSAAREFFLQGTGAVGALSDQAYLFTPAALFSRHGWPTWPVYLLALIVASVALLVRRRNAFWTLLWLSVAITPLGWVHSLVGALPFFVVIWRSGRLGILIVLANAVATLSVLPNSPHSLNASWLLLVGTGAIAILACRLDADTEEPSRPVQFTSQLNE